MTPTEQTNIKAVTAYIDKIEMIRNEIARLSAIVDKAHDISPDAINWGHVGSMDHVRAMLHDARTFITSSEAL